MDKAKRVLALVTVGIIVICIILTLIFGILSGNNPGVIFYKNAWMASAFCMFLLPIILWVMRWIYNLLRGRGVSKEEAVKEEKTEE